MVRIKDKVWSKEKHTKLLLNKRKFIVYVGGLFKKWFGLFQCLNVLAIKLILIIFFHRWRLGWTSKRKTIFKTGKFLLFLVLFFTVAVNVFFIVETTKRLNYEENGAGSR